MPEWIINAWATGSRGKVRVTVTHPTKPTTDEGHGVRREATALYRRTYHDWPEGAPEHEIYPAAEPEGEQQT